jgi:DNA-binding Lrp family transcriptional regulator
MVEGIPNVNRIPLTDRQSRALSLIQSGFPICPRPFARIGDAVKVSEDSAFSLIQGLRDQRIIRRVGASFDSYLVGYRSTLCAIAVPKERVEEVAGFISSYANVTHNYLRENRYNIWFTLIAPTDARIKEILQEIADHSGIDDILNLPAIRLFKIRVDFDFVGDRAALGAKLPVVKPAELEAFTFTSGEKALVRLLQGDLPHTLTPYTDMADELNRQGYQTDDEWILSTITRWVDCGIVRRFGAAIIHQNTGYTYNAMVVWSVPETQLDEIGPIMASFKEVSHCYQRQTNPSWQSNTYTMIHGTSREQCEEVVRQIQEATGIEKEPFLLYSTRELKKTSMRYFMEN